MPSLGDFDILTDNQSVRKQVTERLHRLRLLVFTKWKLFQAIRSGFDPLAFIQAKANASIDFEKPSSKPSRKLAPIPKDLPNRELYQQLVQWRQAQAEVQEVPAYAIAPNRALLDLVQVLPTTEKALLRVKGFGKKRVAKHGADLLQLVRTYAEAHELPTDLVLDFASPSPPKPPKPNTKRLTLDLFRQGKTPREIAAERELKESTILGHLTHWVGTGEVPLTTLVTPERAAVLQPYLQQHPETPLGEIFQHFKGEYSYPELRAVRKWLEWTAAEEE